MTEFDKLCVFLDQFDADHIDFFSETPIGSHCNTTSTSVIFTFVDAHGAGTHPASRG